MFTERRILMATLQRLMAEDVPALPMHDGIMVPRSKAELAKRAMEQASEQVAGERLLVTIEVLNTAQEIDSSSVTSRPCSVRVG